jgi:thioredoxin reductase
MATLGASRFRSHTRSKGPDDVDRDDTVDISEERSKHALMFSTLISQQTARIAIRSSTACDWTMRRTARAVIIATGARYRKPALANLAQFEGAGVCYRATFMEEAQLLAPPLTRPCS